jgi:3D (Asp-Asp-Asp) domain-containing protein
VLPVAFVATYYAPGCGDGNGITATGVHTADDVMAVDPTVIPLGSVVSVDGTPKRAVDTDGRRDIRGRRVDLWVRTCSEARALGRRTVMIEPWTPQGTRHAIAEQVDPVAPAKRLAATPDVPGVVEGAAPSHRREVARRGRSNPYPVLAFVIAALVFIERALTWRKATA